MKRVTVNEMYENKKNKKELNNENQCNESSDEKARTKRQQQDKKIQTNLFGSPVGAVRFSRSLASSPAKVPKLSAVGIKMSIAWSHVMKIENIKNKGKEEIRIYWQ